MVKVIRIKGGGRCPRQSPQRTGELIDLPPQMRYVAPEAMGLSQEVAEALKRLPQVGTGTWTEAYLVEQLLRHYLSLQGDYDYGDLELVRCGAVLE